MTEGGPLWLRVQDYFVLLRLRQDQLLVLTTAVLVTLANRVSPQVRGLIDRGGDAATGANGARFVDRLGG
jgi:hypothetical protein